MFLNLIEMTFGSMNPTKDKQGPGIATDTCLLDLIASPLGLIITFIHSQAFSSCPLYTHESVLVTVGKIIGRLT